MIAPTLLADRDRYERTMEGWCDNTHEDAFTHTVHLEDADRALEVEVVAEPSPTYAIRAARLEPLRGHLDSTVVTGFATLAGTAMVGGFTRRVSEATGGGAPLVVDAAIEVARLARQVAKLPRPRAERAVGNAREAWRLDTEGWIDLPDSCFTYSASGRALLETRTVTTPIQADIYSARAGQRRIFVRRKVARLERRGDRLALFHSMHDNVHGFDLTYELDLRSGRIEHADSVTTRLPYAGLCSEPQGRIRDMVGEVADAALAKRIQVLLGGATGCSQLYDLTADLLKLLRS